MEYPVLRKLCQNTYARCDFLGVEWLTGIRIIMEFKTVKSLDQYPISELQWAMDVVVGL